MDPPPQHCGQAQGDVTYLSFSGYLEDEGHERNDRGGGDDEADPSRLLRQPKSLLLGVNSPGVEGRSCSGQEALDTAAAALLGRHCFVSFFFCRTRRRQAGPQQVRSVRSFG